MDWVWSRADLEVAFTDDGAAVWKLLGPSFCENLHGWLDDHPEIGRASTPLTEDLARLECSWKRFTLRASPREPTSLLDAAESERWDDFRRVLELTYTLK